MLPQLTKRRMLGLSFFFFGAVNLAGFAAAAEAYKSQRTALDDYIAKPDASYSWRLASTKEAPDHTLFAIELTSQTWRTAEEVDRPVWKHWLMVVRPKDVVSKTGFLFIGGGSHRATGFSAG